MSKSLSMENFSKYITDNIDEILIVRLEVEEIQIGFNSAYVEWKADHDAALERLADMVIAQWDRVGPDLHVLIEERRPEEQRIIAERRQELRDKLIPETQAKADLALQQGQSLTKRLRALNPRLDQREEELKAEWAALKKELDQLNAQIRGLSGCLGVVINFFKINKLDRQRQQTIGQLKITRKNLRQVREEWQKVQQEATTEQEALQTGWQELTLKLAQLQGEMDYLEVEANRDALALKRATRHVLGSLNEPIPCPASDVRGELDAMVELNIQTDKYQEGLGSVSSLLSLLDGIIEGLKRFDTSVQGIIGEQRMHSAYLSKLHITIPDDVVAFHQQWDGLVQKVQDDGRLCAQPTEFLDVVRPVIEKDLSATNIQTMFSSLGQALEHATRDWRGS
jgi:predicted  nucleic acid-binding Zn-ribbon protein